MANLFMILSITSIRLDKTTINKGGFAPFIIKRTKTLKNITLNDITITIYTNNLTISLY
jgi:hypothetical protein